MDKLYVFTALHLFFAAKTVLSHWNHDARNAENDNIPNLPPTHRDSNQRARPESYNNFEEEIEFYGDYEESDEKDEDSNPGQHFEIPASLPNNVQTNVNEVYPETDEKPAIHEPSHQTSNDIVNEHEKMMRIEMIKMQILLQLGLTAPPNVSKNVEQLPEPILRKEYEIEEIEYQMDQEQKKQHHKLIQFTSFGTEVEDCQSSFDHPRNCFRFELKKDIPSDQLDTAELWFYKLPLLGVEESNHTFRLSYRRNPRRAGISRDIYAKNVNTNEGWVKFNIVHKVRHWIRISNGISSAHVLELSCETCVPDGSNTTVDIVRSNGTNKPFLMLTLKRSNRTREKRSFQCHENTVGCCRNFLQLNFSEQGWDFIKIPRVITPYYCRGTCSLAVHPGAFANGNINSILKRLLDKRTCCAAKKMAHISILYQDADGNLIRQVLENVVVDECGCI